MLIDSHCHLDGHYGSDMTHVEGVDRCLAVCCDESEILPFMKLLEQLDNAYGAVGTHPASCASYGMMDEFVPAHDKIVAIGEIGLEYHYDAGPRERQIRVLEEQLDKAARHGLPVVIHNRESDEDMMAVLRNFAPRARGVMHCFSSSRKLWEFALGMGFYISFSGIITFNKTEELQDMAANTPNDRFLIETDSPYLAPVPFRGKTNVPAHVQYVARKMAELKKLEIGEIVRYTGENFFKLFTKAKR